MNPMQALLEPWIAPWQRTQRFAIGRMEQWAAMHMESLKTYIDLGVTQLKVAAKVTGPHSLSEFNDSQYAVLSFVGHRMMDDGRMLAEWSTESYQKAHQVARQNLLGLLLK